MLNITKPARTAEREGQVLKVRARHVHVAFQVHREVCRRRGGKTRRQK